MMEEQQGATEAENLLEELGIDSLPILPTRVAQEISDDNFSLVMESKSFNSESILGAASGNESAAVVYINSNIPNDGRYNFTAAHELGHVCMHIMTAQANSFECGNNEFYNPHNDPKEKQANGFASGLLMSKNLISGLTDQTINWFNISRVADECGTSLEATIRRFFHLYKDPSALVIHKDGKFKRFIISDNFAPYITQNPLSQDQIDLCADGLNDEYVSEFENVDASDWVNPHVKGENLETIYSSSISLENGFIYTLLSYDDECYDAAY